MISERQLISEYPAFWHRVAPLENELCKKVALIENAVRGAGESGVSPGRRALVAELGFALCCKWIESGDLKSNLSSEDVLAIEQYINRLSGAECAKSPSKREIAEASNIAEVLRRRLQSVAGRDGRIACRPILSGCGVLSKASADIIADDVLVEVKCVSRRFSNSDLRQLLVYAFLNWISGEYEVSRVELFNPRRGVYYQWPIREFCVQLSGRGPMELFAEVEEMVTFEEMWFR